MILSSYGCKVSWGLADGSPFVALRHFPPHRRGSFPSGDAAPVGATLTCICLPNASQVCSASPLLEALLLPTDREDPLDPLSAEATNHCGGMAPSKWRKRYLRIQIASATVATVATVLGGLRNNRRDRCYRRAPSRRSWHGRLALNVSQADPPSCVLRFIFILDPMFFQQTTGIYIQVLGEPVRCNILAEDL